jgi:hypothetical protein
VGMITEVEKIAGEDIKEKWSGRNGLPAVAS